MKNSNRAIVAISFLLLLSSFPAFCQDKAKHVLLVHAATRELGTTGYAYGSETNIKYIAEYLWGLLGATDGFRDSQVDYQSEAYAHSLADIYYDPRHAGLRATISGGYRNVILFDSEQAYPYPEILYEGSKQLSKLVLNSGSVPMLMMYRASYVATDQLGEYVYRAGNGCGIEVIPAAYAMELASLRGRPTGANSARQAWISACSIYTKITGLDPVSTGYTPSYGHFTWSDSQKYTITSSDATTLANLSTGAINTHRTTVHYNTSYENNGSVVYRTKDVSGAPFNNSVHYFYKGSSTHELTSERIDIILNATANTPLASAVHFLGNQNFDTRDWTVDDLALRAGTFATYANQGLFLFVGGSGLGANAQDIINSNQANLVPMVFDWIKAFEGYSGTTSTTLALDNQDCADLWDQYYLRGWKTIPLTVAMGRLAEKIPNFIASDEGLHLSDPVLYMNASMMLTSALGKELAVPVGMTIRRGSWTQAQLTTAVLTGQEVIKELAYMSETSAYVPDSNLTVVTKALPVVRVGVSFNQQLSASGGTGSYTWAVISSSGLPAGLTLSNNGVLSGTIAEDFGTRNVVFRVTDGAGAFRKVGLKLKAPLPVGDITSSADVFALTNNDYGTGLVATMYSAVQTAPDRLATYRIAIDVTPKGGTSITSAGGLWGVKSTESNSNWWNTFDGSFIESVELVSNIRVVDFNANGGNLTPENVSAFTFKSVTVRNGANNNDKVRVVAGGVANAVGGLKMDADPATIDLQALAGSSSVSSFTLANGSSNSSDRWNIESIQVKYTIQMPTQDVYAVWLSDYGLEGGEASPDADTIDHDGYPLLLEFALGMNPTVADAGSRESIDTEKEGGSDYLVYEYKRRTDYLELGLSYTLLVTTNLITPTGELPYDVMIEEPVGGYETVKARFLMDDPAKFIKLSVQMTAGDE